MQKYQFLLGADDPEMREITKVLEEQRQDYAYALCDGAYVHAGNAYRAAPFSEIPDWVTLVLVECEPIILPKHYLRLDHHRPFDPGYAGTAEHYWESSSLGQLFAFLNLGAPSQEQLVLAAMDHCPAQALRGRCPGVTSEEVLARKVAEIVLKLHVSVDEVNARVQVMRERLDAAPEIEIGGQKLRDLREYDNGVGYSLDLLTAQLATLVGGYAVLLRTHDYKETREKWTIAGHCTPACVEAFLQDWAPRQGLIDLYGVPNRGYAGGYKGEENNVAEIE